MRKFSAYALFILLFTNQFAFAEGPLKVAVLDATIGNGVEENASAIVADTINEQFVKADGYIAIDRAYISKIQAEKKFQLSGEVNSDDVKELGALFGAEFICIANVSKLGSTYTVSARMIDVTTAQVVSQESAKQKGEIDVLFDVAETVGNKLVGKEYAAAEEPAPQKKEETPVVTVMPQQSVKPQEKPKAKSRVTIGYMFAGYSGASDDYGYWDSDYYPIYDRESAFTDAGFTSPWSDSWGIDIESLVVFGYWYLSAGFTYTEQDVGFTDFSFVDHQYTNFYTMLPYAGGGGILPIGKNLQVYGGVTLGYYILTLGDYWSNVDESASGFAFGIETGVDFFMGDFCLTMQYKYSFSGGITGDVVFTDAQVALGVDNTIGTSGLILGLGFTF